MVTRDKVGTINLPRETVSGTLVLASPFCLLPWIWHSVLQSQSVSFTPWPLTAVHLSICPLPLYPQSVHVPMSPTPHTVFILPFSCAFTQRKSSLWSALQTLHSFLPHPSPNKGNIHSTFKITPGACTILIWKEHKRGTRSHVSVILRLEALLFFHIRTCLRHSCEMCSCEHEWDCVSSYVLPSVWVWVELVVSV